MKRLMKLEKAINNGIVQYDLYDINQVLLVTRGSQVTSDILRHLINSYIYIKDDVIKYKSTVNRDLILSKQIKSRVEQGISYIFSSPDTAQAVEETSIVSGMLMKNLLTTKGLSVTVEDLKVSDEYTFKHSVDVASMGIVLGSQLGLDTVQLHELGMAGLLHDIGKIKVPQEILNKPSKLTDAEFEKIKSHTVEGYNILKANGNISDNILLAVRGHHEKFDGTGYPDGLSGVNISLYARILEVVDVYDALVTERPYHEAYLPSDAIELMMATADSFDITILSKFIDSIVLYSVGSIVTLSNGRSAKVIENIKGYGQRPIIKCTDTGELVNLTEDSSSYSTVITGYEDKEKLG